MNRLARACGQLAAARREPLNMRQQVGVASRGDLTVAGQLRTHAAPQPSLACTLGAAVARAGASQLHVAETEKYAQVTYFFNGGEESALPGEQRAVVPSQRDVPTYDLKPQMSAREVVAAFELAFASGRRASR